MQKIYQEGGGGGVGEGGGENLAGALSVLGDGAFDKELVRLTKFYCSDKS